MPKPPIPRTGPASERMPLSGLELFDAARQEASPLARMNLKPNNWRAYVTFKLNHSAPVVAGPLASGNYTAYHPKTIEKSYESLLHQQVNLRHQVRQYDPVNIPHDRIVGSIIGVHFPGGDWSRLPAKKEDAPCITCVACVAKQAQGVDRLLGQYLSSRSPWSVSIETVFEMAEAGIYLASAGRIIPNQEMTDEMWNAVTRNPETGKLLFGRYQGEQMVVAPGGNGNAIEYQGVGFTPTPGERDAYIESVQAESAHQNLGDGWMALAAEALPAAPFRAGVWWLDAQRRRTRARVLRVHTEGEVRLGLDRRAATAEQPVLQVRTAGGLEVLRSLASVHVC